MSKRATRIFATLVALLVLVVGLGYTATRSTSYQSEAKLLLAPKKSTPPDQLSTLFDGFANSGTAGTYVELISAPDTLRRAGATGVTTTVRWVPDTRTIDVTAESPDSSHVQRSLDSIIRTAQAREAELGDVWQLQVLASPSAATVAGISNKALIGATFLLAILAALFVVVVLRRYRFMPGEGGLQPAELAPAGGGAAASVPLRAPAPAHELEQPAEVRVHFDLEGFRFVKASPTTVLLQVTGYWRSDYPRQLAQPTLLLHDGSRMHPLAPLQAPDGSDPESGPETPLWRGSYAAPIEIFERHERAALRAGPGVVIGLPNPIEQSLLSDASRTTHENGIGPEHGRGPGDAPADEHIDDVSFEADPGDVRSRAETP